MEHNPGLHWAFFCFIFMSTFFHLYYSLYCFSTSLLTWLCCSPHLQITLYKSVKKKKLIHVFSFIWFHYFNCCALSDFLPRNLLKLAVGDVHNSFHVEVKTACDAFFGKCIDWAVPLSITSGRLCYRLSNCTILSLFSPPPLFIWLYKGHVPLFIWDRVEGQAWEACG